MKAVRSHCFPVRRFLKVDIVVKIELWDWKEKLMNKLRISSHFCQYLRKAWELKWP